VGSQPAGGRKQKQQQQPKMCHRLSPFEGRFFEFEFELGGSKIVRARPEAIRSARLAVARRRCEAAVV
jgi:hypothetical protein